LATEDNHDLEGEVGACNMKPRTFGWIDEQPKGTSHKAWVIINYKIVIQIQANRKKPKRTIELMSTEFLIALSSDRLFFSVREIYACGQVHCSCGRHAQAQKMC